MAVKDKYGNNLRRGYTVSDVRERKHYGEVVGTVTSGRNSALIRWEDGNEEVVQGKDLIMKDQASSGRRR